MTATSKAKPRPASSKLAVKSAPPPKRARKAASPDPSSSGSGSDDDMDKVAMLAALNAHSRAMFGFDGPDEAESSTQAQARLSRSVSGSQAGSDDDQDGDGGDFESDDGWGEGDDMVTDSEDELEPVVETKVVKPAKVPEVVFAPTQTSSSVMLSKSERRAFLNGSSTKMMGIKQEVDFIPKREKRQREDDNDEGDEEDQNNTKLDKTLHDMLLTTLLPSAQSATANRPVDKRNAVTGRLLELANFHLPGEGSKTVSTSHLSSHPAKIRTGMVHAKARREAKSREESEAAGSFVRGLGGLGGEGKGKKVEKGRSARAGLGEEVGKKKGQQGRKDIVGRDRGLAMGVGRFKGGMLTLTESEIARGTSAKRDGPPGRGRGGRGGRGVRGRGGGGGGRGGGKSRGGW